MKRIIWVLMVIVVVLAGCQSSKEKEEERSHELLQSLKVEMSNKWEEVVPYRGDEEVYAVYGEINTVGTAKIGDNIRYTIYGFEYISRDRGVDIEELLEQTYEGHSEFPMQPFVRVVEVDSKGAIVKEEWY